VIEKMEIPAFKYYFPEGSVDWITKTVKEMLESGDFITMGKYCTEFEREFSSYVGSKHAIAVSNGTGALEVILRCLDVGNHEIIVPTNTFAATAYAVIRAEAKPVFADISVDLNVDPKNVKKRLNSRTKAIMPVHIGGLISPNVHEILNFAEEQNTYLVEDAAHAHGSMLDGKKAGSFSSAAGYSFFSTKVITTGEGGMIVTNDDEIADKACLLRDQGKIKGNFVGALGYNWRMTEIQAIVGLAQLRLLEEIIEKRGQVAKLYDELLKNIPLLEVLHIPTNVRHNYYKYIAFLPKNRDPEILGKWLKEKYGVRLGGYVYEAPLHSQPIFERYVDAPSSYPIADDLCTRHISLPIYPQMTDEEAQYVVGSIKKSVRELGWT
jgi:perosamine synthetase